MDRPAAVLAAVQRQLALPGEAGGLRPVPLPTCGPGTTLPQVQAHSGVEALRSWLAHAALYPEVGYNAGKQELSFMLALPTEAPADGLAAVLHCMLGLLPAQREVEDGHRAASSAAVAAAAPGAGDGGPATNDPPPRRGGSLPTPEGQCLANRCLLWFAQQTHVGVVDRRVDFDRQRVRIAVQPCRKGLWRAQDGRAYSDTLTPLYAFAPRYDRLTGWDPAAARPTRERFAEQLAGLRRAALQRLWAAMEAQHYVLEPGFRQQVSPPLELLLTSGIKDQTARFVPSGARIAFYLHGTPGVGKSTFVRVLSCALEGVLRETCDPGVRVDVVKVPLNVTSAGRLDGLLFVKGISDCSVERILEQTVVKGHLALFHLEEGPEDAAAQAQFFDMTQSTVKSLLRRYPEYQSNVLYVMTSNYPPAASIAEKVTVVYVQPPAPQHQQRWCTDMLQAAVRMHTGISGVEVEVHCCPAGQTKDMRDLGLWWLSLAYFITRHLKAAQSSEVPNKVVIEGDADGVAVHCPGLPPLALASPAGHFFVHEAAAGDAAAAAADWHGVPSAMRAWARAVLDMYVDGFLRPAVVVVCGGPALRAAAVDALLRVLAGRLGEALRVQRVAVLTEQDKDCVLGSSSELMGGLFRFIDEVNNPARSPLPAAGSATQMYGVVVATVNVLGQFVLRELLETGPSATHWQQARKDRLLYVLDLVEGTAVSAMIHSRSQCTLHCE